LHQSISMKKRSPARQAPHKERGFSLIETIVAAGIVAGAFAALAQMFALSIARNNAARDGSAAMVLAGQKMEQLRGLVWGIDLHEGGDLGSSAPGFADYVDQAGNLLGAEGSIPRGTVYVRRWSVIAMASRPDVLVLQVLVSRPPPASAADAARLITLRSRNAP
jgi:type II secretory pathway pseudopilin PulG